MNKHKKMAAACEKRQLETNGACRTEDCYDLGWCSYVFEAAKSRPRKPSNCTAKEGSGGDDVI